jgi:hypothetical protein
VLPPSSASSSAAGARPRLLRTLLAGLLLAVAAGGCVQRDMRDPRPPSERGTPWQVVVAEAKAFTLRIGYVPTANFTHTSEDLRDFPFCGQASRLVLPYSYEDPAIEWLSSVSPDQCRSAAPAMDIYHGASEAVGEVASPVTPAMIASGVPRMIYLVVHEDCHDQFTLPYGIEEPLCETLAYHAMKAIAAQPGPWTAAERRAIRDYALEHSGRIPLNFRYYQQVSLLYARHARGELREAALLAERAAVFARAEASTGSSTGSINNVVLANRMTYARHHAFMERTFERLGSDLKQMVAFFQQVDAAVMAAAEAADAYETLAAPAEPPALRDKPPKSGPRQRPLPLPLPRASAAGRSSGGARPTRPPSKAVARAEAGTGRASAGPRAPAEGDGGPESPAGLLARIQAAEADVLDIATRLLAKR